MNNLIIFLEVIISLVSYNISFILGLIPLLLISLIFRRYNKNLEFVYLIFLFISYVLGFIYDLYNVIYYYDAIVHSLFGIIASIYALPVLKLLNKYILEDKLFNIIFIFIFTLFLAGFWEIIEFTIDIFFKTDMQISLNNTMKDIISALLFSILYIIVYSDKYITIDRIFINKS